MGQLQHGLQLGRSSPRHKLFCALLSLFLNGMRFIFLFFFSGGGSGSNGIRIHNHGKKVLLDDGDCRRGTSGDGASVQIAKSASRRQGPLPGYLALPALPTLCVPVALAPLT